MPSPRRPLASPCLGSSILLLLPALTLLSSAAYSAAEESTRVLSVGEELVGETMPLRHGRRVYRVDVLRPSAWYEVKISYGPTPTSIPSSFSIRLVHDPDDADWSSKNRKLLNTEKIFFKAEGSNMVYVLVIIEPEGVVAKPNVPDREDALFNIGNHKMKMSILHIRDMKTSWRSSPKASMKGQTDCLLCQSDGVAPEDRKRRERSMGRR